MALQPNDRVVCVDATPIPINAPGFAFPDFSFPGGFIEEGVIYCIDKAYTRGNGTEAVTLVGHPVYLRGQEIAWNGMRFRRLSEDSERVERTERAPHKAV